MDKKSLLLMVVIVLVAFGIYFSYEKFAEESPEIMQKLTCGCVALGATEGQQDFYDACEAAGGTATVERYTSGCGKKCIGKGKCGKKVQCSVNVDGVQSLGMSDGDCTTHQTIY